MGFPMAGHLSKLKNIDLYVHNRTLSVLNKWLKKYSATKIGSLETNQIKFDGLIICLKDDLVIESVLLKDKLIKSIKNNGFIIDHSTTSLDLIKKITTNKLFKSQKNLYFDAPVTGGQLGAINGRLSIMVGGSKSKFPKIKPLINSYSNTVTYIGPNGHGQLTKMVNQLCIAGLIQGLSEGIALGSKSNLEMDKVFKAISDGAAQSWQMDNRFHSMIDKKFNFGFAVDLMIKDLKISLKHANSMNLNLNISKSILKKYKSLSKLGYGDFDTSSLIKLLQK